MIYIIVFILLIFLSFHYDICGKKRNRDIWYNIVLVIFILIAGLRWRVGVDTIAYIDRFYYEYPVLDNFSFLEYGLGRDPFYALINVIVKTMGGRFYMVQIIQATIVNTLIFKYIKRHSDYIFTCVLFYFFINYVNYNMEVMRGSISIAICLFGNDYIMEKKWLKGYILYLIAALFHFQTIVIFVLPSLFWIRFNKTGVLVLLMAFVIGFSLKSLLADYMFLLGGNEMLEGAMEEKLYGKWGEQTGNLIYFASIIVFKILYPLLSFFLVKKYCHDENKLRIEPFVFLGIMFVLIQFNLPIAFRYVYYFEPYFVILFAEIYVDVMAKRYKTNSVLIIQSFIIFLPLFYYYGYNKYKTHKYHPYTSVIEMSVDPQKEESFQFRWSYSPPNKNRY